MRIAVDSVRTQTYDDWRLLVVDDCFPEPWLEPWLAEFDDPRISYRRNPVNLGANATYVKALGLATSDHVVFMGADDRCHPDFLARAVRLIQEFDNPEIIQPGVAVIDEDGAVWNPRVDRVKARLRPSFEQPQALAGERLAASLLTGNWAYFPSLVWNREVIGSIGFREFHIVQDLALLIDVIRGGGRMVLDPQVTFDYRRHAGSDSSLKTLGGPRFQEERAYCSTIAGELRQDGWRRAPGADGAGSRRRISHRDPPSTRRRVTCRE
jgi:hypothetical protein